MERNQTLALMKAISKADPSVSTSYSFDGQSLSYNAMNETLRNELQALAGNYNLYRANKVELFSLIEETLNEVMPKRILDRYAQFAEVRAFAQGDRPVFTRKMGRTRMKQFVTRVGLAGRYEVAKLGGQSFEVMTNALGGAIQIGFEEFLDGRADWSEMLNIIMEGIDDMINREIAAALIASINQLPAVNKVSTNGFNEAGMDRLVSIARAYGNPAIYCCYEFATKMIPATGWVSDEMRNEKWAKGYLGSYKGCPVILIDNSFEDETNSMRVINPAYAWVIPSGADMKPVKVALEGGMHMKEHENDDWSHDLMLYQKIGVGVMTSNNICSYVDTSLGLSVTAN